MAYFHVKKNAAERQQRLEWGRGINRINIRSINMAEYSLNLDTFLCALA